MKTKVFSKTVASVLIICIMLSMISIAAVTAGAATTTYISDVRTGCANSLDKAKKILTDEGYTVIHHDMNNKVPNQNTWIYVGYKTTTNINDAITGLIFSKEKKDSIQHEQKKYTIEKGKNNFNAGAGGDSIYLYYTKDKSNKLSTTEFITALDASASTDDFNIYKQNYKTVCSTSHNHSQNVNAGVDHAKQSYLVYNSILDPNAYKKQGENALAKTITAANGVTYYDIKDNTASANFVKTALSSEYNGTSQVELWADVLYSMLEIKGQGNGYRNDTGKSFDTIYGKGEYLDVVSALKNGTGNNSTWFSNLFIESTGLKSANNPKEVYDEVIGMFTSLKHGDVGVDCSKYSYSNIDKEVVDLDGLRDATSSSDVLYTICRVADDNLNGSQSGGHDKSTTVMGMMFSNFQFVPIVEDGTTGADALNYSKEIKTPSSKNVSTDIVVNNTAYEASRQLGYSSTTTDSVTNSISSTNGKSVSFSQGISVSVGSAKLLPVSVTGGLTIGFDEAFNFSSTTGNSVSFDKSTSTSTAVSETIPSYSIGVTQREASTAELTRTYDCPMALTYDVSLFSTGAELGKENMFYTSFAYNSSLFATFGDDTTSAVECLNTIVTTDGAKTNGFRVKCIHGDDHETRFSSYSKNDWSNIINNNVASGEYPISTSDAMQRIINFQPMSFNGGKITSEVDNVTYTLDNEYSILPIDKISVFKTNANTTSQHWVSQIKLDEKKEYRFHDYYDSVVGYTKNNTPFTNWDMSQGYWVLVKEDGTEMEITPGTIISDGIVSVREDAMSGNIYITPLTKGSSHIRYKINETDYFQYYDYYSDYSSGFDASKIKSCTNDMITRKGTIEIVSQVE